MVDTTIAEYGRIDVLYNNALLVSTDLAMRDMDILKFDPEVFYATMRVNVVGGVTATTPAAPPMLERGNGSIILTSSGSSPGGDVTAYSYGSSNALLNWNVQAFAATLGKQGVRSTAILPGPLTDPK